MIRLILMLFVMTLFSEVAQTPEFHGSVLFKQVEAKFIYDQIPPTEIVEAAPVTLEKVDAPIITSSIIPDAKPETFKIAQVRKLEVRKCWRTTKGTKKYRLRKVCRPGEKTKP